MRPASDEATLEAEPPDEALAMIYSARVTVWNPQTAQFGPRIRTFDSAEDRDRFVTEMRNSGVADKVEISDNGVFRPYRPK